jgi:SAM-dependent methyltransferase
MAAALAPAGLFLRDSGEPLTIERFRQLAADGTRFRVTVDYRDQPPPVEELDVVGLVSAHPADLRPGTLVLTTRDDGFELVRLGTGPVPVAPLARVTHVERRGRMLHLDAPSWRLIGALSVRVPGFTRVYRRVRAAGAFLERLWRPLSPPIRLGSAETLIDGVRAKYGFPPEVAWSEAVARQGLEEWEDALFTRILPAAGRVLVVGAGAGREAIPLAARGFTVTGIDLVPGLVDAARRFAAEQGVTATFIAGDVGDAALSPRAFDAIVVSHGVLEHTPTRARRVALLRKLAGLAAVPGAIVIGVGWHATRGRRSALVDTLRVVLRRVPGFRSTTEPGDRLVRHLTLASDGATTCYYHAYRSAAEIAVEVGEAGLTALPTPEGPWIARILA